MFESITEGLTGALKKLTGRGKLTEKNIEEGLRAVRQALLEADVHYQVVKSFIERVKARAVGQEVIKSIRPGQQVVKIVQDELVELMGPGDPNIERASKGPTVIMMCGLQGSGKTTTCGKLALYLRNKGLKPMLVAADVQRPAAIEQLEVLGERIEVPVYSETSGWLKGKPVRICRRAVKQAEKQRLDVVILDTAGRLHIDDELMKELETISRKVKPENTVLVVDAMVGQDAVTSAKEFNDQLEIDGVILTKLDGDARGGAALSIKEITGKPIKFVGVGEKLDAIEEFHPDRMASRILGMGDVVTLVEKAQATMDQEKAQKMTKKLMDDTFNLEDFRDQLNQIKRMGPIKDLLKMIPGLGSQMKDIDFDGDELRFIEAIICSMTKKERRHPEVINNSRKRRIARGSGTTVNDVNMLLKQFEEMKGMVRSLGKFGGMFGKKPSRAQLQKLAQAGGLGKKKKRRRRRRKPF